ncbi:thiamine-monophosphate kinase [Nautilia profundicola AmH]|uniref:Thiamine-monophosphate kinase n=1 Tax=Nautilia profundicola (strain ATCC BAA-1463 / DSM 18972 / AmH) TaxID=598659 RepID=B9LA58_NAUPA|nr:thiamine-phosphate kinase [Nautilia profundicola]ACM92194.1 thiamine-monophosphate kinase [Nautilia profundicola AmH]
MKEEYFIKNIKSKHIGDDAAVIGNEVMASDSFFEDIHFKKEWMSLKDIAIKASLVNISDIIVMNAKPKYALLNIGFPKSYTLHDIKELTEGFNYCAEKYNYEIIGGDTIKNDKLAISMTFIGECKKPVFRKAKINEYVAYTGDLGDVKKELNMLLRGGKISKKSKFIRPRLRDKFFYKAAPFITSALDISDGLFKELERISKISKLGYKFFYKIDKRIGCSGEEYEVLFTFNKKYLPKILNIAKLTKTKVTIFALTKRGSYKSKCRENHF